MSHEEIQTLTAQIEEATALATNPAAFSNLLFGPGGLFQKLGGDSKEERMRISQSDLYRAAKQKLRELKIAGAEEFRAIVESIRARKPNEEVVCAVR